MSKPAVLCETAPRYQNGPVLGKTGFSDKNVAVLCDNGQGPETKPVFARRHFNSLAEPSVRLSGPVPPAN